MEERSQPYHARIPPDLAAQLQVLATRNRRSVNAEILLAIESWLAQQAPS